MQLLKSTIFTNPFRVQNIIMKTAVSTDVWNLMWIVNNKLNVCMKVPE